MLSRSGFVPQRLEGNRYLDDVTIVGERAFRFHHDIDAEIDVDAFSANTIHLNPERIEREHIGFALIVEGIQQYANAVFDAIQHIIAFSDVGADFVRIIKAMESDIEGL